MSSFGSPSPLKRERLPSLGVYWEEGWLTHWLYFDWTSFILPLPFFDIQIKLLLGNSLHHKDVSVCVPAPSSPNPHSKWESARCCF